MIIQVENLIIGVNFGKQKRNPQMNLTLNPLPVKFPPKNQRDKPATWPKLQHQEAPPRGAHHEKHTLLRGNFVLVR